jgi:hypothetical protein
MTAIRIDDSAGQESDQMLPPIPPERVSYNARPLAAPLLSATDEN